MRLASLLALFLVTGSAHAQFDTSWGWGVPDTLYADFRNVHTHVHGALPQGAAMRAAPSATFEIEFGDGVSAQARNATQFALDLWGLHLSSSVPIRIRVNAVQEDGNTLAFASPRLIANFQGTLDPNTFYPTALASSLAGRNVNPDNPDIEVSYNASFNRWYFGTDGNPPPNQFDFVSVMLHEVGHGIGFIGSMRVDNEVGSWGLGDQRFPVVFDRFTETDFEGVTTPLIATSRFPNPSSLLGFALQSDEVYFNAPEANRAQQESQSAQGLPVGPGGRPKLHAPPNWAPGSSYGHLTEVREGTTEVYYPPGSLNSLMTPTIAATEVIHSPGPVFCGMLRDMGWPLGVSCEALLGDREPLLGEPLRVLGPFPNPSVGGTPSCVRVHIPEAMRVRVDVFDLLGRRVQSAFDGRMQPSPVAPEGSPLSCGSAAQGYVPLQVSGLAAGVYIVRVLTDDAQASTRMTVVR